MKSRRSWKTSPLAALILVIMVTIPAVVLPVMAEDSTRPKPVTSLIKDLQRVAAAKSSKEVPDEKASDREVASKTKEASSEVVQAIPAKNKEKVDENKEAAPAIVNVTPQGRVEMHVRSLDLETLLQMLSMQSQRNIVASKAVSGTVTANFYGVTFEEALRAILDSNDCGWFERGNFIYVHTNEELEKLENAKRRMASHLFKLYYAKAKDVQAIITPMLSKDGKISLTPEAEAGIASDPQNAGGSSMAGVDCLLVVDYEENIEAIARVIDDLDVPPKSVLVEATILRAQLNEDNAMGIDFTVVGGVDFEALNSTSAGITNLVTGALPQAELDNTNKVISTDFASEVPDGGLTFGLIKNSVAVFLRALESVTDVSVMANPKVLTLNKQRGEVIVGRRDGYLTTTVTETAAVQNVEFLETGTQLLFRPFIGDDGRVRMELHPEDSAGGLTAANLPFEQTTEVTTNVLVRDGETILIGGLFRESDSANRSQLPILGNIPILGALVRNNRDLTQREEIIILLTVHIVKDDQGHAMVWARTVGASSLQVGFGASSSRAYE